MKSVLLQGIPKLSDCAGIYEFKVKSHFSNVIFQMDKLFTICKNIFTKNSF